MMAAEVAGKSPRGGRIAPAEWERRTGLRLRFIYRRCGLSLLLAGGLVRTYRRPRCRSTVRIVQIGFEYRVVGKYRSGAGLDAPGRGRCILCSAVAILPTYDMKI